MERQASSDAAAGAEPSHQESRVRRRRRSSDEDVDEDVHSRPSKRRNRAPVACRLCRTRKTRCDNRRPSCGYCSAQGAVCQYPDGHDQDVEIEASNAMILQKVTQAVSLLEEIKTQGSSTRLPSPPPPPAPLPSLSTLQEQQLRSEISVQGPAADSAFSHDGFGRLDVPVVSARTSACESLLNWPCHAGLCPKYKSPRSFGLEAILVDVDQGSRQQGMIQQDDILGLSKRFLSLIHIKNPFLDVVEFNRLARNAAEYGPGWSDGDCLVLLACALACVAVPYDPSQLQQVCDDTPLPSGQMGEHVEMAEAYFSAAQRRLGLLQNTLLAVQCKYLAGLYSKFMIRPLTAWTLFQGACAHLQALLYAKAVSSDGRTAHREAKRARHIEQRLYWSCFKAEGELRAELQLPASGLSFFRFPDLFPSLSFPSNTSLDTQASPSAWGTSPQAFSPWSPAAWQSSPPATTHTTTATTSPLTLEEERSWLYYLAEISLRGIMNRVLTDLYGNGETAWLGRAATGLAHRQEDYVEEVEQWYRALPHQLSYQRPYFSPEQAQEIHLDPPSNELSFFLQTRHAGLLEWIYRPSMYAVLHGDAATQSPRTSHLAQLWIMAAQTLILLVASHHRHGGVWGLLRRSFGAGVLLIGVKNYTNAQAQFSRRTLPRMPVKWIQTIQLAISTIRRWDGSGAPDLAEMRKILEMMLSHVASD